MFKRVFSLCAVGLLASVAVAHADTVAVFTGSQAGTCCFNVTLDQKSTTDVQVTVTLTDGAQYFASSGNGTNHPGFAFNLGGLINYPPAPGTTNPVSVSNLSSPWSLADVTFSTDTTNGPALGTFDFEMANPGNGANAKNAGPLVFDVQDLAGLLISNFVKNNSGYYFAADIMDSSGATGESGISSPGSVVPEPSPLLLLGTGILAAALFFRRQMASA